MIAFILSLLGRCPHRRTTFPQGKEGEAPHVCCLDCGKEFTYDWSRMRIGPAVQPAKPKRWFDGLEFNVEQENNNGPTT